MSSPSLTAAAAGARGVAREILGESRFHTGPVPRPLHGLLEAIGKALSTPAKLFSDALAKLGAVLPGGPIVAWIVVALLVAGVSALIARRWSRLALLGSGDDRASTASGLERATELERRAEQAEREGMLDDAVRLRFRAGLARLNERGKIPPPRSAPTAELARTIRSGTFDELARRFEEIAYGAAHAQRSDLEDARRGWSAVLSGSERG